MLMLLLGLKRGRLKRGRRGRGGCGGRGGGGEASRAIAHGEGEGRDTAVCVGEDKLSVSTLFPRRTVVPFILDGRCAIHLDDVPVTHTTLHGPPSKRGMCPHDARVRARTLQLEREA